MCARGGEEPLPFVRRELLRLRQRGELRGVQDLVGIGVADAAHEARIGEGALERVIFRSQGGAECRRDRPAERRFRRGRARAGLRRRATTCSEARRLVPASVRVRDALGEVERGEVLRPASFAPGGRQCSRPAIIRCSTSQRSPSSPMAMRLPMRRISRTVRPSASASGGSDGAKQEGACEAYAFERLADDARIRARRCRRRRPAVRAFIVIMRGVASAGKPAARPKPRPTLLEHAEELGDGVEELIDHPLFQRNDGVVGDVMLSGQTFVQHLVMLQSPMPCLFRRSASRSSVSSGFISSCAV